jgi:two-component sensor histidine kinase
LNSAYSKAELPKDKLSKEKEYDECINKAIEITNGQKSLPYSLKAAELALAINDENKILLAYTEISHDYERLGDLTQALQYVLKASERYTKKGDLEDLGTIYNRIGSLYSIQKNTKLAILYLQKAIGCHKQVKNQALLADDLNNLGEVYRLNGEYKTALSNFQESLSLIKDSQNYAYVVGNIGLVYAALNANDSSKHYLELSTRILKKNADLYPITVYLIENAGILFKNGKTSEAIEKAKEALRLSESQMFREQIRDASNLLVELYLTKNDYKNAFFSLKQYNSSKDSLVNSKIISDMAEMRADVEVSKKETEIKALEAINKLHNRINWILGSGLVIVFALTLFLIKISRQRKHSNQLLSIQKTELEQKNEIINASLIEKETLLKEIHHRVKNNLQIISSLLNLQSRNVKNKKALEAFSESQRRLHSIALVHQKLYQNENLSRINIKEYLSDLVDTIHQSFYSPSKNISYEINITDINFDVDTAVPLGLIVNELVTNAYKYAFIESTDGIISINLQKKEKSSFILDIKDNGKGLPKNFDINDLESLGMKLVNILTRQLDGKLDIKSENGAEFIIEFIDIIEGKA